MQYLRRFVARLRSRLAAWSARRRRPPPVTVMPFPIFNAAIFREVTPHGVRVFSLCASCGARLEASATLCEDCAHKQSRPARP